MKRTMFSIVLFSVLCVVSSDRIYINVGLSMTPAQAKVYCRSHYNDLAAVESEADFKALAKAGSLIPNGQWWTGLYDDVNSWRWSLNQTRLGLTLWDKGKPDNVGGYEDCVALGSTGLWDDQKCDTQLPFYCYNAEASPSFVFVNESNSWSAAQDYCRVHFTDLALVLDQNQTQNLMAVLASPGWIGLYRDSWKWTDGTPGSLIKWSPGYPTVGGCGYLSSSVYLMISMSCQQGYYFICQKIVVKRRVVRFRLKNDSSLKLEEISPKLQELTQVWTKLGLNTNVKFKWLRISSEEVFNKSLK